MREMPEMINEAEMHSGRTYPLPEKILDKY